MAAEQAWCRLPPSMTQAASGGDAQTLEISAMEVTDNRTGDATMLPELLSQMPELDELMTVIMDGAVQRGLLSLTPAS